MRKQYRYRHYWQEDCDPVEEALDHLKETYDRKQREQRLKRLDNTKRTSKKENMPRVIQQELI